MYAIVLAGGNAKRLWPMTLVAPKALLPIGTKPILDYIVEKLKALNPPLSRIVLSINERFMPEFQAWKTAKTFGDISIVPDNEEKDGRQSNAITAMARITGLFTGEDVLVMAGDGMFRDNLSSMVRRFNEKRSTVAALYRVKSLEEAKRCATVNVRRDGKILDFSEKPTNPETKLVCGAVYLFPKDLNNWLLGYLDEGFEFDSPGRFLEWLCKHEIVYGQILSDYLWDIGTIKSYQECNAFFCDKTS